MSKGRLNGLTCYEAGPIDRVADNGRGWRDALTPFLRDLGVTVYDPLNKPIATGLEDDDSRMLRKKLIECGEWDELSRIMREVRIADLRMVDKADFLVIHVDTDIHLCGTYEEIFWANRSKKPAIVHCKQGKAGLPQWLFGTIRHEMVFSSWEAVRSYLWHVHTAAEVDHLKRWLFFKHLEN